MPPHSESDARFAAGKLAGSCDDLKKQLLGLLDSSGRVAEEVHSIRKLGKSLRGGFSLFGLKQSSGGEIQAIGRLLSEPRDATSRLKTWNTLAWNGDPPVAAAIAALINQQTRSTSRRPPGAGTSRWFPVAAWYRAARSRALTLIIPPHSQPSVGRAR